ncbi:chorismate mutase / prephenate dehydrogenase [Candidatus Mancarchaeum acidiphilum]|uniref:Chorismate mutase / prephenate dehydrogenase n=1 Tax=Candidatus Mancarchaeum acidiphilum TaxID=1920749 RepID=A0A218NMP3_9ARCH|nr:prephenate dehydrogenase/arogenate dehydrogenase family protein [Candidatus Mancarchaeum acidiphilum]ASI13748.1 chorismate mutase / prephenate dehydrogenase [Candidatus Mancarchaeum acidiphilum]
MDDLNSYRKQIDEADEGIIKLIKKRFDIVKAVGEFKRAQGMPLKDNSREDALKIKWKQMAEENGVDGNLGLSVITDILRFSKEQEMPKNENRLLVIGYGGMGLSIASYFHKHNFSNVYVTGRHVDKMESGIADAGCIPIKDPSAKDFDTIIMATPPESVNSDIVEGILQDAEGKLVMDIFSVKTDAYKKLLDYSKKLNFKYVSVHPLFGPNQLEDIKKIAVITDGVDEKLLADAEGIWSYAGFTTIRTTLDEHEKAMAIVQVLRMLDFVALKNSIGDLKGSLNVDYSKLATVSFEKVEELIDNLSDDNDLIHEIVSSNRYSKQAIEALAKGIESIKSEV